MRLEFVPDYRRAISIALLYPAPGRLILSAGHQINETTLEKIHDFELLSGLKGPIFVGAP